MILSLDLGSTSFKAAVVDQKLRIHGSSAPRIQHRFAAGGKVEIEVGAAASTLRKAIRGAIKSAGVHSSSLRAVAVTSQAQTFTVLDRRGRPKMPFISWQDARAGRTCEKMSQLKAIREIDRHCGFGTLLAALQICEVKHLQETRPGFIAPDNLILNLPTFFVCQWTGVAAIDENLASMSGLYSLALRKWWPAALRICSLHESQLPELRPIGGVAALTGDGAKEYGLPGGIPVVLAGNDQTAGAYAAKLDENHGVLVTLGTAQVACAYAKRMPRPSSSLIRGPFPHGGFYRMAADTCGGSIINWAKTVLAHCTTDKAFDQQAAKARPGSQGLVFDPNCDTGRGAWNHIGLHHTTSDFARSVLESLTRRMAEMIRQLGVRPDRTRVLVAGGGSRSAIWVRILSDTLGTKVRVTQGHPILGAARMALNIPANSRR